MGQFHQQFVILLNGQAVSKSDLITCQKMSITKTPGEVAAISGYDFQYEIFATEIYNHLLNDEVVWVEFASAHAGKLDDVLIGLQDRVIAYQVKEITSSNFSYQEFTVSDTESIFAGAFKGWQNLKANNAGQRIDARFITTQAVSEHDTIAAFAGKPKPSFEKFIRIFWEPLQAEKYDNTTLPAVWQPVADELAGLVKCDRPLLIEFIKEFSFVFDYKLNAYLFDTYTQAKRNAHIDSITKNIFRLVAKKGNVKFTKTQFLQEFGLKNNFETHFQHAFFVDEKHYQPIKDTISFLEKIVAGKTGGYIALVGNAGSGKSTLLTKWLSDDTSKVLKYYSYTNLDMGYDFGYRGEASFFLHDILVQIRENRLTHQDRLPENDVIDLQKHLHEELGKLSLSGEKVFIIVDGLDHIEREQHVDRSLINVLPNPKAIPPNIYFVLGSRTVEQIKELSFDIQEELNLTDSIATIHPLSKIQVGDLLKSYQLTLTGELFEELYINTKGHPLFLRYTLQELQLADETAYQTIITAKKFGGDIYKEYQKFWNKNKDFDEFAHILGLISRFRYPYFDTELLQFFNIKGSDATKVNGVSEFYFYKSDNIWQFFHNSFKEFLIEESARDRFTNKVISSLDQSFHLEIAEAIKNISNEYRFNVLYHFYKAGRFKAVTEIVSQDYFRSQWFAFRNHQIIFEDLKLASQASYFEKNLKSLTVSVLAVFELDQRVANFSPRFHYDLFLIVGWLDVACSYVFDNARLLTDQGDAMDFARLLHEEGYPALARELFSRATPINLFEKNKTLNTRRYHQNSYTEIDEVKLATSWAKTGSLMTPLPEIIDKLRGITIESEAYGDPVKDLVTETIFDLSDYYANSKELSKLWEITELADKELNIEDRFAFYFELLPVSAKGTPLYQKCFAFFDLWEPGDDNSENLRYALVYTLFEFNAGKSKPVFEGLLCPVDFKKQISPVASTAISNYLFNYARLYFILTKDFSLLPESLVPQDEKPVVNSFNLTFVELGRAYAWIFHDYPDASTSLFRSIDRVLGIFHYRFMDPLYDSDIAGAKGRLVTQMLRVAAQTGAKVFNELLDKLSAEWEVNRRFWNEENIQEVIEWVIKSGNNPEWCIQRLESLDQTLFESGYINERIEDGIRQVRLWAKAGEKGKAELMIKRLMSVALDVPGENDSQLDYIVNWIEKIEPLNVPEIQYYFDRLDSINDKVNSPSHTPASALLELSLPLGNSFGVFENLLFRGLEDLLDGMETLITDFYENYAPARKLAVKIFVRIILGLDNNHSVRQHFIHHFFKSDPAMAEIKDLIADIEIYAIQELRNDYLYNIHKMLLEKGIDPTQAGLTGPAKKKSDDGESPRQLRLATGEYLSEQDLFEKIHSLDDVKSFEGKAEAHSYYNWTDLIIKVIPITGEKELEDYLVGKDRDISDKVKIAKALSLNGKTTVARNLLIQSVDKTRSRGWGSVYDGGGKVIAYEQLLALGPKADMQDKAFKDFAFNLADVDTRSMELLLKDLDKVFSLFTDQVDMLMIYEQIVSYRTELLRNHTVNKQLPVNGNTNQVDGLSELIYFLVTFPSTMYDVIFPVLIEQRESLRPVIDKVLKRLYGNGFTVKFLQLLAGAGKTDSGFLKAYHAELLELLQSDRFDLFYTAARLLDTIAVDWERSPKTIALPLGYKLTLTPQAGLVDATEKPVDNIDEEGFLKDTNDPLVFTKIIAIEIKILARITGFTAYNLAYRIRSLGIDPQFPEWCAAMDEETLRKMYDSTFNLKISYKRPQVQRVFDGLGKVMMELTDLGLLDSNKAAELMPFFDEGIYFFKVSPRPGFVKTILSAHGSSPSADRKWAKELSKGYVNDVLGISTGDRFILAEKTVLSGMAHGSAVETRQSYVDVVAADLSRNMVVFPALQEGMTEDYLYMEDSGMCIYNAVSTVNPKENWLAVNPLLAEDLGLHLNTQSGNFRWDNDQGETVVESVYWQEADPSNKSGHHNSEAGFGWLVLITKEGLVQLNKLLKGRKIFHHKKVHRHLTFVQQRFGTYIDEQGEAFDYEEIRFDQ